MIYRLFSVGLVLWLAACTNAGLYDAKNPPIEANRIAVRGEVCTEDPELAKFPVRLLIVADQANGPLFAEYDPAGQRLTALNHLVNAALQRQEYSIAVVGYGPRANKLAPVEGAFSRNPGELLNAITQLSLPEPCGEPGFCRDYNEALRVAGNIIKDDLANVSSGERGLTQYVILLVNGGQHEPLAGVRACCARGDASCRNQDNEPSQECQMQVDANDLVGSRPRTSLVHPEVSMLFKAALARLIRSSASFLRCEPVFVIEALVFGEGQSLFN